MKVLVSVVLLSVAAADGPSSYYPKGNTGHHYGPSSYKGYYDSIDSPKPYQFAYSVDDPVSGSVFSQNEESDGKTTKGYYSVNLPDGHIQHVDYHADDNNGYNADVTYTGKAQDPVGKRGYGPAGASYYPSDDYKRSHPYQSDDDDKPSRYY